MRWEKLRLPYNALLLFVVVATAWQFASVDLLNNFAFFRYGMTRCVAANLLFMLGPLTELLGTRLFGPHVLWTRLLFIAGCVVASLLTAYSFANYSVALLLVND